MNPSNQAAPADQLAELVRNEDGQLGVKSLNDSTHDQLLTEVKAMREQMQAITVRLEVCAEFLRLLARQVDRVIGGAEVFHVRTGDH